MSTLVSNARISGPITGSGDGGSVDLLSREEDGRRGEVCDTDRGRKKGVPSVEGCRPMALCGVGQDLEEGTPLRDCSLWGSKRS